MCKKSWPSVSRLSVFLSHSTSMSAAISVDCLDYKDVANTEIGHVHISHPLIVDADPDNNRWIPTEILSLGSRVGLLSQQTVSKLQGNGKSTQPITHLASTKQIYNLLSQFLCN